MDPITLLIAALVVSGMTVTLPRAVVDAFATAKAASAGQWDFLDRDRERRATRVPLAERWAAAWSARRRARHEQAGGDGTYRPGAGAYAADLYHGFWERRLEVRKAKVAARRPYVHDPDRPPWHERVDAAILGKVEDLRAAWGQRRPDPEPAGAADPPAPEPVEYPPGTVTYDDNGQQVPLGPPSIEEQPVIERKYDIPDLDFEQVAGRRADCDRLLDAGRGAFNRGDFAAAVAAWDELRDRYPDVYHRTWTENTSEDGSMRTQGLHHTHAEARRRLAEPPEPTKQEDPMTTPTTAAAQATEVNTNEDARRTFTAMAKAAKDLADAASLAEKAHTELVALTGAGADGMAAKRFDAAASSAMGEARDVIDLGTLGDWSEKAEVIGAQADAGLRSLDKYQDSEALVAENQIDPTTLAATSS